MELFASADGTVIKADIPAAKFIVLAIDLNEELTPPDYAVIAVDQIMDPAVHIFCIYLGKETDTALVDAGKIAIQMTPLGYHRQECAITAYGDHHIDISFVKVSKYKARCITFEQRLVSNPEDRDSAIFQDRLSSAIGAFHPYISVAVNVKSDIHMIIKSFFCIKIQTNYQLPTILL